MYKIDQRTVMIAFLLLSVGALAILSCRPEDPVWSEEFDYTGLPDPEVWVYDIGNGCPRLCGWGNNEIQYYTEGDPKNARVEDGKLIIEAIKGPDGVWTSARIKTQGKKAIRYGRIEIRARVASGAGIWPALWMLGSNIPQVGWPKCGEIDIMEHVGKAPGRVHATLHTPSSHGASKHTGIIEVADLYSDFHVYEAHWTPEQITFSVDGQAFYTYAPQEKNDETWPYDNEHFFIVNIAVGGNWGSDPRYESAGLKNGVDPGLHSARMEVDYIRVYPH